MISIHLIIFTKMAKVRGEDVVLKYSDDMYSFICARSIQFNINREMIETSVSGSGFTRTFIPGAIEWGGTLEGLVVVSGGSLDGDISVMYSLIQDGTLFQIRWYEQDTTGTYYLQKDGYCYINSISEISSFDNMVTFNASFTGSGPITITTGNV